MAGAYLHIFNTTEYILKRRTFHSYQMNSWDFPEEIHPGETKVYIEWNDGFVVSADDGGEARYATDNNDHYFEIQARGRPDRHLQLVVNGYTPTPTDLGWQNNGAYVFCII